MRAADMRSPQDLTSLQAALAEMTPESRLLAGGTDLVIAMRRGECRPDLIVDLSRVRGLGEVQRDGDVLRVGALATFSRLQADPLVRQHAPCLAEAAAHVGSVQIRNVATLGGNVANASPCGDGITALVALDTHVSILDAHGRISSRPIRDLVVGPHATSLLPRRGDRRLHLRRDPAPRAERVRQDRRAVHGQRRPSECRHCGRRRRVQGVAHSA